MKPIKQAKAYRHITLLSAAVLSVLLLGSCAMYRTDEVLLGSRATQSNPTAVQPAQSQQGQKSQKGQKLTKEEKKVQKAQKKEEKKARKAEKKAQKQAKKATGNSFRPQ